MKKEKLSKDGFTLIELMVAVALMLLLVGGVIRIFTISTEVCTRAEAQMSIYQNARATLALIAKESMCPIVKDETGYEFEISNDNNIFLKFVTSTSWLENNGSGLASVYGTARIEYRLADSERKGHENKMVIKRRVYKENNASFDEVNDSILCEFLDNNTSLRIERLVFDGSSWDLNASYFSTKDNDKLPPAIKISINLIDEQKRENRSIHRTIWIAPATGSGS